jgi:hypothetical protein
MGLCQDAGAVGLMPRQPLLRNRRYDVLQRPPTPHFTLVTVDIKYLGIEDLAILHSLPPRPGLVMEWAAFTNCSFSENRTGAAPHR